MYENSGGGIIPINFEIFADDFFHRKYLGIACLFVPVDKKFELVESLTDLRCLGKNNKWVWNYENCHYNKKCKDGNNRRYHTLNNCKVHYQDLASSSSRALKDICNKWIDFLLDNNKKNKELIFFKILYIDLSKLDEDFFGGDEKVCNNIYNRFFRTVVLGSRYFFGTETMKFISKIYHHKGHSQEIHPYFSYNTGKRLNREDDFKVLDEDVQFIEGDHKFYFNSDKNLVYESQLIQFIDLILGSTTRNLFNLSKDPEKIILAEKIKPLVERIIETPNNINSSFNYYRKQDISFFPESSMKSQENLFGRSGYLKGDGKFKKQKLVRLPRIKESGPLDKWFK